MMLVLCSNGLTGETLISSILPYTRGYKTAALVVTADNIYKEKNYHVRRGVAELESLNLSVDIIDIDESPAETLLSYDVVSFIGGNPYYLLKSIRERQAESVLRYLAENKILIGWSAAAFVFGPSLNLVDLYSPEMNTFNLKDLTGLQLTKVEVLPHYSKFISRFDGFEATCTEYEKRHSVQVIRLNDGDAVFIGNDEERILRAACNGRSIPAYREEKRR